MPSRGATVFGGPGPYERLTGRALFRVDPNAPAQADVVDIGNAPAGPDGLVHFAADFMILKPRNGNGRVLFDYGNRGHKRALQFFNDAPHSKRYPSLGSVHVYNTYVDHMPAAPEGRGSEPSRPEKSVASELIERLDVSETWKRRFRIIERAGGPDLPKVRDLPPADRRTIGFNFLGFFFGPFYYLAKGLWQQALLYTLMVIGFVLLLEMVGLGFITRFLGYGVAAVYGIRANTSYYRKAVLGDAPWL